jgi:hypothetical protein
MKNLISDLKTDLDRIVRKLSIAYVAESEASKRKVVATLLDTANDFIFAVSCADHSLETIEKRLNFVRSFGTETPTFSRG